MNVGSGEGFRIFAVGSCTAFRIKTMSRILLLFCGIFPLFSAAQLCSETSQNVLCAEGDPISGGLVETPISVGCLNSQMSYYAMFTTGSQDFSSVTVSIIPGDCDDFTGQNQIFFTLVELSPGGDACNPADYGPQSLCYGTAGTYAQQVNNLGANTDYLLVLGSDHDPVFGPCEFTVSISGPAVDITTNVSPYLIYLGGTAQINAYNATGYSWSPPDYLSDTHIADPTSAPLITTQYTVTGQIGPCTVTANATVTVGPPLIIYDAITPNNDGINDTWTIRGIERFEANVITVYDRWGQQVFRSTGYPQPWDGTNKGKPLPMGAYYYVIELNSFDVEIPPITGIISIVK